MTGDVNFSGRIAKKIDLTDIQIENLDAAKKEKLDAIFNTNKNGDSKDALTVDELTKTIAKIDTDKDGKLSDAELTAAWEALPDAKKQGLQKTEYISYIKAMAEKNAEKAKDDNIGNGYTIQLGEDLDDLVARVLKSQGISEPTEQQTQKCRQAIIDNNPDAMKIEGGQVKWLLAGAKIYLPTDTTSSKAKKPVKDQDNRDTVIERYNKWKSGQIQSFKYKVDENGNQYEVRTGQTDTKYGTVDRGGISSSGESVVDVDLAKAVDVQKLKGGKVGDKEYSAEEVQAKATEGLNILAELKDADNIESVTKDEKNKNYYIVLKSGSSIFAYYDDKGKITEISVCSSGDKYSVTRLYSDGKLSVNMDGDDKSDFTAKHGIKDFGAIERLIKSHDVVREKMGLPKQDFVDFSMITDNDLGENNREEVEGKIKSANDIIAGLEISSGIDNVKTEKKDDHTEKTITMKDGTVVKAFIDKKGSVYRVNVKKGGDANIDVTYDLKDNENKITVNLGGDKDPVEIYDAIKDVQAIKQFVKNANKQGGTTESEETGETTETRETSETGGAKKRVSKDKAEDLARKYYDIAAKDSGDNTAARIKDRVKKQVNKDNVVEIWEASKKGVVQDNDSSLLDTITSEWISEGAGGGRAMAVQTAKHIMSQLVERAKEVGVDEMYITNLQYWIDYDYSKWINGDGYLPATAGGDAALTNLLEPKIDALVEKIKEQEKLPPEKQTQKTTFTQKDAVNFGKALLSSMRGTVGADALKVMEYNFARSVNKDNAAKVWKAFKADGGVQGTSNLIYMMSSQYAFSSGLESGRSYEISIAKHIMQSLIDRAKELDVDEDTIYDLQECLDYDYSGWINGDENLPESRFDSVNALNSWLSPKIDALVEAIEEKEKEK